MTSVPPPDPDPGTGPADPARAGRREAGDADTPREYRGMFAGRRARIDAELQRNRAGDYTVPTWVLALILFALIAAVAAVVVLA